MFTHLKNIYKETIKERRVNHKRHYETPQGKLYKSVTTITSILSKDSIEEWRKNIGEDVADYITRSAGAAGTQFHNICESYLNNEEITETKILPLAHFNNLKEELDKIDNIRALEAGVYSDKYKIAGRVDAIAEYDGVLSIIDFKTSKYKKPEDWVLNYFVQATAYRECWLERTKEEVNQIVILMTGLDGSVTVYKKDPRDYIEELKETIIKYEQSLEE